MKHLSTATKARAEHALASGTRTLASSVDSLQTGTFPGQVMMKHIDPHHYGHDLALLPQSRRAALRLGSV